MPDTSNPKVGYLALLRRNAAFRNLWRGEVVSLTGDWFTTIALFSMLLEFTGKGESVGFALIARFLPAAIFGPMSGVFADRFSRRAILILCDVGRAVIVLGFLLVRGPEDVWLVYLLTFLQLTLTAFFETAEQASIGSVVTRSEIVAANSLQGMTWSAMLALGALLGGLITGYIGVRAAFVLDAATFLLSAYFVSRAAIPLLTRTNGPRRLVDTLGITDTREGIRYLASSPGLRQGILAKLLWGFAGGAALMLYSVFGERVYTLGHSAAGGIGLLYAARGVGALLGPFLARLAGDDTEQTLVRWIGHAFWLCAVSYLAFALMPSIAPAALALIFAHMGVSTNWTFSTALLNLRCEDALRGRVFAADMMLFTLATIVAIFVAGRLLDGAGLHPRTIMIGIAVANAGAGIVWWIASRRTPSGPVHVPLIQTLREPPRPPEASGET